MAPTFCSSELCPKKKHKIDHKKNLKLLFPYRIFDSPALQYFHCPSHFCLFVEEFYCNKVSQVLLQDEECQRSVKHWQKISSVSGGRTLSSGISPWQRAGCFEKQKCLLPNKGQAFHIFLA
jgi:hypothetical protein